MPWTPTQAFKHPLVTVKQSNAEKGMTNQLSFTMADVLSVASDFTWDSEWLNVH
jgi:hypothetical protein